MKAPKGLIAIFFAIAILLNIGIAILNDDSSKDSIIILWSVWAGISLIVLIINYIRNKTGAE